MGKRAVACAERGKLAVGEITEGGVASTAGKNTKMVSVLLCAPCVPPCVTVHASEC